MANRFWVGGTASWDGTAGSKWSTTSGGAGGAAVPTSSDDVFLDANSGTVTITLSGSRVCKTLTTTGFTGTLTGTTTVSDFLTISGNVTLNAGGTFGSNFGFRVDATCSFTSAGATMGATFTLRDGAAVTLADAYTLNNGLTLTAIATFNANNQNVTISQFTGSGGSNARTLTMGSGLWTVTGSGGVWDTTVATNFTLTVGSSTINFSNSGARIASIGAGEVLKFSTNISITDIEVVAGGINANNNNVTLSGAFTMSGTGTKSLLMGTGTWTLSGTGTVWDISGPSALTVTPSTSTVKITDTSSTSKTFNGGSKTYNSFWIVSGSGTVTIKGDNTFNDFRVDEPATVQFEGGSTTTITTWSADGSAASGIISYSSNTGAPWNIVCTAGIAANYIALADSHAHGPAGDFTVTLGVNNGGNFNWTFVQSQSEEAYFDSFYQYSGSATATVTGLNWLIGETLGVVADGVDIGDAVVSAGGTLTLPSSLTGSLITVGKRYTSRLETLRAPETGNKDGTSLGRRMAIKTVAADILNTPYLEVGTLTATERIPPDWRDYEAGQARTGMFNIPIEDSHFNEGVVVAETDRGYAAVIRALRFGVESEP